MKERIPVEIPFYNGEILSVSLHSGPPEEEGSEVRYPGYSRMAIPRDRDWWQVTADPDDETEVELTNRQDISFPPCPGTVSLSITHFALSTSEGIVGSAPLVRPLRMDANPNHPEYSITPRFLRGDLTIKGTAWGELE